MVGHEVDYSLYLVTGRDLLPLGKDYFESLEEALKEGVTLVQIREKTADTGEFLEIARQSQTICKKYRVPILINDRIDIALAIKADGVHLGQTDMPISVARTLLPQGTIIGVTCNTPEHVRRAVEDGADYVGLGPVWGTKTKDVKHPILGPRGIARVLLPELEGTNVKSVAIAGIKSTNLLHCLHGSVTPGGLSLDGVAVVSDIVASVDPSSAARRLATIIRAFKSSSPPLFSLGGNGYTVDGIKSAVGTILSSVRKYSPLVHQITNNVVMNQSANATIALGASPIMASSPLESEDLSKVTGSLLINFGTIENLEGMLAGGKYANINRKPVVFDPVGVGASHYRKASANELLNTWQATVIKGNAAELGALANSQEVRAKGVDSVGGGFANPARFVRDLAKTERCIVVLTGVIDWVSDGETVIKLSNGNALLGKITGSGCMVGTAVATFCAGASLAAKEARGPDGAEDGKLVRGDMLLAAVGGVLAITIASEFAALRASGSGTFLPALIDELGALTEEKLASTANIEIVAC